MLWSYYQTNGTRKSHIESRCFKSYPSHSYPANRSAFMDSLFSQISGAQRFLPEHDCCVRVFAVANPPVCLSSVTLVHPTQGWKLSAIFLYRCVRWLSSELRAKFYGDRPRETPPSGALNAKGVSK